MAATSVRGEYVDNFVMADDEIVLFKQQTPFILYFFANIFFHYLDLDVSSLMPSDFILLE